VPPSEMGFDRVGMVRRTNPFSSGMAAGGIGATASFGVVTEEVIVWDVAGSMIERPSAAWESDQHRLTLIAIPILMDHLITRVCIAPYHTTDPTSIQVARTGQVVCSMD
jgi:hypothetical protein